MEKVAPGGDHVCDHQPTQSGLGRRLDRVAGRNKDTKEHEGFWGLILAGPGGAYTHYLSNNTPESSLQAENPAEASTPAPYLKSIGPTPYLTTDLGLW